MLRPIPLDELLQAPDQTLTCEFKQLFEGFESLIPVEGSVRLIHHGNFLEAFGETKTIVTMTCHRCLQQFNHRLELEFNEILWIEEPSPTIAAEVELGMEDLVERIPPHGSFDVEDWIYQNLYLGLPVQLACRLDCPGFEIPAQPEQPKGDPRWAALRVLQAELEA